MSIYFFPKHLSIGGECGVHIRTKLELRPVVFVNSERSKSKNPSNFSVLLIEGGFPWRMMVNTEELLRSVFEEGLKR